jgi:hypothetical protein
MPRNFRGHAKNRIQLEILNSGYQWITTVTPPVHGITNNEITCTYSLLLQALLCKAEKHIRLCWNSRPIKQNVILFQYDVWLFVVCLVLGSLNIRTFYFGSMFHQETSGILRVCVPVYVGVRGGVHCMCAYGYKAFKKFQHFKTSPPLYSTFADFRLDH